MTDASYKNMLASDWLSNNFSVYALLRPGANAKAVSEKMTKLVHDNFKPPAGTSFSFSLQPLKDIHLNSKDIVDGARNSNVEAIAQGSTFYIKDIFFRSTFCVADRRYQLHESYYRKSFCPSKRNWCS